jgi:hypothetical protein
MSGASASRSPSVSHVLEPQPRTDALGDVAGLLAEVDLAVLADLPDEPERHAHLHQLPVAFVEDEDVDPVRRPRPPLELRRLGPRLAERGDRVVDVANVHEAPPEQQGRRPHRPSSPQARSSHCDTSRLKPARSGNAWSLRRVPAHAAV